VICYVFKQHPGTVVSRSLDVSLKTKRREVKCPVHEIYFYFYFISIFWHGNALNFAADTGWVRTSHGLQNGDVLFMSDAKTIRFLVVGSAYNI